MNDFDIIVIGGGPAGAATAIQAARGGASVAIFEKAPIGRDKVCGDGLTPRAIGALQELDIDLEGIHKITGLRMIAGKTRRELKWPTGGSFPPFGAVWTRKELDSHLLETASQSGAKIFYETEALPEFVDNKVIGVTNGSEKWTADLVVAASGAPGKVARMLGAERKTDEPYGLAIRTYVESPRHADEYLEASLAMRDANGTPIPGYGWMFPTGNGTVNLGVGALSTMKGFRKLNLNTLCDIYRDSIADEWEVGPYLEKPRAWRLPMTSQKRHGNGWVAVGDAAGLINPMNGEGIDYSLESGMLISDLYLKDPQTAPDRYDRIIGERFDGFLRTGRRFSFLIGHPLILRSGLRVAVSNEFMANMTLQVMGNLVDSSTPGAAGRVLRFADKALATADPLLRRTRAKK
ncbi:MAG: geranylgeranyl reductase family protein [Actinomycetota bacterium]|nr:geranylgeranyl reductase family protein [Actinomycetota bacterium]MED5265026.1 geranylgeranyl reductase family protein [Actinomycetota bacterium]